MYIDCQIIRDLLPLYKDGALSEKSRQAVSRHLENCPYCRRYLRNSIIISAGAENDAPGDYKKLALRIKRRRTISAALAGGAIATLLGYGIYKTLQDYIK